MYTAFEQIMNSQLIEKLFWSKSKHEFDHFTKMISMSLIQKKDSVRKYTDQELFMREDPNSCLYFPYELDLAGNQFICRKEFDAVRLQEFKIFENKIDFLLCLKDNFRDYVISTLYQLFYNYYSITSSNDVNQAKNFLNDLLTTHDYLNSVMKKINHLLGEKHKDTYKFYMLCPTNHLEESFSICFHIKTFINFPEKIFICKDNRYLNFEEQILKTPFYKTRKSMIIKCPKCNEQYHKEKNSYSNVGSYHEIILQ